MFVPVACLKCGKPFQVPAGAAGTDVVCPWCKETTTALPVVATPETGGLTPTARQVGQPEPLPLEDDLPEREPRPPARFPVRAALAGLVLVVAVTAGTVVVLGYGAGRISPSAWAEFTPPDGSCTLALPGTPTAERVEPNPADGVTRGGERFTTTGWYSRVSAWVGWQDLDPAWAKQAQADRDRVLTAPVIAAERDRRAQLVGGTIAKEADVRFGPHSGRQVVMTTPRGQLVEQYVLVLTGPHPRLYFLGVEGKNVAPGDHPGPAAERVFHSFRVREE